MPCKNCTTTPVYTNLNNQNLCKNCFIKYFERKVYKTLTKHKMVQKGEKIGVGVSGGKDSITTLYLLQRFFEKQGNELVAIAVNEGIKGYRDGTIKDAEAFCKQLNIPLNTTSYKKEFGFTLDEYLKKKQTNPCATCGVLRRSLLNKAARRLKVHKLATGHNLDDEAQSILMNQMKGNLSLSAKLGPITGVVMHKQFIPRIKPLYFMTEKEVTIYTKLKGFDIKYTVCPNFGDNFRESVGRMLNQMEAKIPGTKQGIVNSFIDILPVLRKKYQNRLIGTCKGCGEPAAKDKCRVCEIIKNN
jgi:tRNA-5-methyluridine54 2-sulfurtransferase